MTSIDRLKDMLGNVPTTNFQDYFDNIAKILMTQCVISKGETKYEIVEIEFYLYSKEHQDVITYPRELAAGQWYFHQSGVDLTFESNTEHFGGILIRGVRNISTDELTLGPQKCVNLLWDKADAFKVINDDYPTIIDYIERLDDNIRTFPRWISVKEETKTEKISDWSNRVIKNKSPFDKDVDKNEIVFSRPYRFIKFDLIDSIPRGWFGYSAKPMG